MNKVMEVARADDVTGNLHSVAITAPDRQRSTNFYSSTIEDQPTKDLHRKEEHIGPFLIGVFLTLIGQGFWMLLECVLCY